MNIDLHCHSKFSHDNYLEPEVLIEEAIRKKLNGVCFTEHYSLNASLPVEKITLPEGFYVFRGLEISTDRGHILVYGLKDDLWNVWARNNYLDCIQVMKKVHSLGGICVPAHPFRGWESLGEDVLRIEGFDAIETCNGLDKKEENERAVRVAQLKDLPSIGGSDCHNSVQVGRAYTAFRNPVHTIEDMIREVKLGNCKGIMHPDRS
jgi:predicted metal-dependent phosphoesterase TrpH